MPHAWSGLDRVKAAAAIPLKGEEFKLQSGDCGVVDPEGLRYGPAALASFEPIDDFLLLMRVELGFAAEVGATFDGGDPALVSALHDPVALVFGHSAQEGDERQLEDRGDDWLHEPMGGRAANVAL